MRIRSLTVILVCLSFCAVAFVAAPVSADDAGGAASGRFLSRFSIQIGGGGAILPGGDLRSFFGGEASYYRWLGTQPGYATRSSYPYNRAAFLPEFEIIWQLTSRFELSAGVGYLKKTWSANSDVRYDFGGSLGRDDLLFASRWEARDVPLSLSAIYSIPAGRRTKIHLQAGVDCHLVSFHFTEDTTYSWPSAPQQTGYLARLTARFEPHQSAWGGHVGAGAETPLFSRVSFVAGVLYRAAEVRVLKADMVEHEDISWTGNQSSTSTTLKSQTLWYGKTVWSGATYATTRFAETKPDWLSGARAFRFGLSGVVVQAGIKIRL